MTDNRTLNEVKVNGAMLPDAVGELRHKARLLTLAIMGLVASPHEIEGMQGGGRRDIDDDWRNDIEALAWNIVDRIDGIVAAVERPQEAERQDGRS